MKTVFFTMLLISLSSIYLSAQTIKSQAKDSTATYRANDRLKTSGPVNGWPAKADSSTSKINVVKPAIDSVPAANKKKKRAG